MKYFNNDIEKNQYRENLTSDIWKKTFLSYDRALELGIPKFLVCLILSNELLDEHEKLDNHLNRITDEDSIEYHHTDQTIDTIVNVIDFYRNEVTEEFEMLEQLGVNTEKFLAIYDKQDISGLNLFDKKIFFRNIQYDGFINSELLEKYYTSDKFLYNNTSSDNKRLKKLILIERKIDKKLSDKRKEVELLDKQISKIKSIAKLSTEEKINFNFLVKKKFHLQKELSKLRQSLIKQRKESFFNTDTFRWLRSRKELRDFCKLLIKRDIIEGSLLELLYIFSGDSIIVKPKVKWLLPKSDFAQLIRNLEDYKCIDTRSAGIDEILKEGGYFIVKDEKPILETRREKSRVKNKALTTSNKDGKHKKQTASSNSNLIDEIFKIVFTKK